MKAMSVLIIVMYLLLPVACLAHPCESCFERPGMTDTSGNGTHHSHSQDSDNCDSTVCCADSGIQLTGIFASYAPVVSEIVTTESYQRLPAIVMPIITPPQNLS